jgi:hypothetical protein
VKTLQNVQNFYPRRSENNGAGRSVKWTFSFVFCRDECFILNDHYKPTRRILKKFSNGKLCLYRKTALLTRRPVWGHRGLCEILDTLWVYHLRWERFSVSCNSRLVNCRADYGTALIFKWHTLYEVSSLKFRPLYIMKCV